VRRGCNRDLLQQSTSNRRRTKRRSALHRRRNASGPDHACATCVQGGNGVGRGCSSDLLQQSTSKRPRTKRRSALYRRRMTSAGLTTHALRVFKVEMSSVADVTATYFSSQRQTAGERSVGRRYIADG